MSTTLYLSAQSVCVAVAICRSEASFVSINSVTAPSEPLLQHAPSGGWPGQISTKPSLSADDGQATDLGPEGPSSAPGGITLTVAAVNAHK